MKNRYMKLLCVVMTLMLLLGGVLVTQAAGSNQTPAAVGEVYVGGMPFGVKFTTEGVTVVGFCDVDDAAGQGSNPRGINPAREAGIKLKDVITHVNGTPLSSAEDLTKAVEGCAGKPISLTVRRTTVKPSVSKVSRNHKGTTKTVGSEVLVIKVTPVKSQGEGRYKTGLWVRDCGAGIGTVTFIIPSTNAFAGLGHGICDGETGELIPMQRGVVTDVTVSGIDRGEAGDPGAIKGYFAPGKKGALTGNTECGVYGIYATRPDAVEQKIKVAERSEVRDGDATILCTLDNGKPCAYTARISHMDMAAQGSKCFTVTVTDPALISKTGGIVQGMSGSPIIQNGKLVGAVTHVLVNDPTTGYGIFIDNMLRDMPELLK